MSKIEQRNPHALYCDDPSLTHQCFKDECDISNIMKRYTQTGLFEHMSSVRAQYGDFSNIPDYQSALNVVIEANEAFNSLDAKVRARFDNDPGQFLSFCENPENRNEMISLGLIEPGSIKTDASAEAASSST